MAAEVTTPPLEKGCRQSRGVGVWLGKVLGPEEVIEMLNLLGWVVGSMLG